MTETSVLMANPVIPWYQSAGTLRGFIWIEQNGQVVGGSQTVASAVNPAKTGDTPLDLKNWVVGALQALMGAIVPDPAYSYPGPLGGANEWGIDYQEYGGTLTYPFVAVAYTDDFRFGTLNVPTYDTAGPRKIRFRITGRGTPDQLSPAEKGIKAYHTANNANPILLALELNPE